MDVDVKAPGHEVKAQDVHVDVDVKLKALNVKVKAPDVDVEAPDVEVKAPDVEDSHMP